MALMAAPVALALALAACGAEARAGVDGAAEGRRLQFRHASAHLNYASPLSDGAEVRAWYNALSPLQSSESTFFATNAQAFGYLGLQQVEDRGFWFHGQAIFSIWDAGCSSIMNEGECPEAQRATVVECGELALCDRFGGEGTGFRSTITFDKWELRQTYGFMVQAFPEGAGAVRYDGYVYAPELGGWQLLSKIRVGTDAKPWHITSMHSFVEQWDKRSAEDVRWGLFGPSFVESEGAPDDEWAQIRTGSFSHTTSAGEDTTHNNANVTSERTQWGLGIGGDLVNDVAMGDSLTVDAAPALPEDLALFGKLRRDGALPTGCGGGTCYSARLREWYRLPTSKTYFPVTAIVSAVLACVCCCCVAPCCLRCCVRRCAGGRTPPVMAKGPFAVPMGSRWVQPKPGAEAPDLEAQDARCIGRPSGDATAAEPRPSQPPGERAAEAAGMPAQAAAGEEALAQGIADTVDAGLSVLLPAVAEAAEAAACVADAASQHLAQHGWLWPAAAAEVPIGAHSDPSRGAGVAESTMDQDAADVPRPRQVEPAEDGTPGRLSRQDAVGGEGQGQ